MAAKLTDVFDVEFLQKFQDAFSDATGMASICVDLDGPVTRPSNFTRFCNDLTRGAPKGMKRCIECDLKGGEQSSRTGQPAVYFCHAGLMDFGAPIMVDGQQVGSILGGQVLTSPPDEEKFRRIAAEIDIDPDEYVEALRKVKIVPEQQIRQAANLLHICISEIAKVQTQFHKLGESHRLIQDDVDYINEQIQVYADAVGELSEDQKKLYARLLALKSILDNISRIVKAVERIAQRTKLISFNATVEAARSGQAGKGFGVIAQEIRSLADETSSTLGQIEGYTSEVLEAAAQVLEINTNSSQQLEEQVARLDTIFPRLGHIVDQVASLNT